MPDPRLGEEVKAFVAPMPGVHLTETEVIDYVKERMAVYKYPRMVEFRAEMSTAPPARSSRQLLR